MQLQQARSHLLVNTWGRELNGNRSPLDGRVSTGVGPFGDVASFDRRATVLTVTSPRRANSDNT